MEKKVRIKFEHHKFIAWSKQLEEYCQLLQKVLDKYVEKGILKISDVVPELVRMLFKQDYSMLLEIVRERGLQGVKSPSYALSQAIAKEVRELEQKVKDDVSFLNSAQLDFDWAQKSQFATAKDGKVIVEVDALREYLTTYMTIDDETQALIDRCRQLWGELKQLDNDLQKASIMANARVRLIGNDNEANALISVTDSDNVLFDEKVFVGLNGNVQNPIDDARQWIVRELES